MLIKYFPQAVYLKERHQSYLDSAATTLKLQCVIDTVQQFYEREVANVHRGDHYLSDSLTSRYEGAREQVKNWIGAQSAKEIVFTKSTTESLNLLAFALEDYFQEGEEIWLTEMEHHSNILPWQALAKRKHLKLKFLTVDSSGCLQMEKWQEQVTEKTKLMAFTYYSNALGLRNPVEELVRLCREQNILTVIDSAQAMTAEPLNVQKLNCDFVAFSGHKLFAPTGVGVLYVRQEHFSKMRPFQVGGGMVSDVSLYDYERSTVPQAFEAGTPPIESALALGVALDFLKEKDFFKEVQQNKKVLLEYAEEELKKIPSVRIIGDSKTKVNILSFVIEGLHGQDLGQLISQDGVAVRSGHHCCIPLMKKLNLPSGTVRAGFSVYNDEQDVEKLVSAVKKAKKILST